MQACRKALWLATRHSSNVSVDTPGFPALKNVCQPTCRLSVRLSGWISDIPESLLEVQLTCLFARLPVSTLVSHHAGFADSFLACLPTFGKTCGNVSLLAGLLASMTLALLAGFPQNSLFGLHAFGHVFWKAWFHPCREACLESNGISISQSKERLTDAPTQTTACR
jgi:hypothetical protein